MLEIISKFPELTEAFSIYDYEPYGHNISVLDGNDLMLFEYSSKGIYTGHYFFQSRGREAISQAKKIISKVFERKDVYALKGLTPLSQKGARWLTRQLGATSFGEVLTEHGPCEFFLMTKEQWRTKWDS